MERKWSGSSFCGGITCKFRAIHKPPPHANPSSSRRHYTQKFRYRLFRREGCKGGEPQVRWKVPTKADAQPDQNPPPEEIAKIIKRFEEGTLG